MTTIAALRLVHAHLLDTAESAVTTTRQVLRDACSLSRVSRATHVSSANDVRRTLVRCTHHALRGIALRRALELCVSPPICDTWRSPNQWPRAWRALVRALDAIGALPAHLGWHSSGDDDAWLEQDVARCIVHSIDFGVALRMGECSWLEHVYNDSTTMPPPVHRAIARARTLHEAERHWPRTTTMASSSSSSSWSALPDVFVHGGSMRLLYNFSDPHVQCIRVALANHLAAAAGAAAAANVAAACHGSLHVLHESCPRARTNVHTWQMCARMAHIDAVYHPRYDELTLVLTRLLALSAHRDAPCTTALYRDFVSLVFERRVHSNARVCWSRETSHAAHRFALTTHAQCDLPVLTRLAAAAAAASSLVLHVRVAAAATAKMMTMPTKDADENVSPHKRARHHATRMVRNRDSVLRVCIERVAPGTFECREVRRHEWLCSGDNDNDAQQHRRLLVRALVNDATHTWSLRWEPCTHEAQLRCVLLNAL